MKAYSLDLRKRVLWDVDAGLGTQQTADKYRVSTRWIQMLKRRRTETGQIEPRRTKPGPKPRRPEYQDQLIQLVAAQPDATLCELQQRLTVPVSRTSLWRTLKQLGLRFKKSRARGRTGPA